MTIRQRPYRRSIVGYDRAQSFPYEGFEKLYTMCFFKKEDKNFFASIPKELNL